MNTHFTKPSKGCLVLDSNGQPASVQKLVSVTPLIRVDVKYLQTSQQRVLDWRALRSGLRKGAEVEHIPSLPTQLSLGYGTVRMMRNLNGREQALVEFPESGRLIWMPHERLIPAPSVRRRFDLLIQKKQSDAERLRLRTLAQALATWNENTGSLSRLDIDPLPHQIHLVHHILRSGNLNWLIADDVGLGKTIEVGMLMSALVQRGTLRRVLLIVPAGLVRQWKEEMRERFGFHEFMIYGTDFQVDPRYPEDWKRYSHVVGSIDRLKQPDTLKNLLFAENWDLVVFDEAHRLSRRQYGRKLDATERYRLAQSIRKRTESMILLSATPHQGFSDKFQALLELLRPDLHTQILSLDMNPEILGEIVFRNPKSEVIDQNGNLIFQGKDTHAIQVQVTERERCFDAMLQNYLTKGYDAREEGSITGRAIGFVMTVYRKLAASSFAAIETALQRRLEKIKSSENTKFSFEDLENVENFDERFIGEWEERVESNSPEFFVGETQQIQELLELTRELKQADSKVKVLMEDILIPTLKNSPKEKFLIFTEYRSTQEYLVSKLQVIFGEESAVFICGGQTYDERERVIYRFEEKALFLVSTEAGGEGINLQKRCHIIVNFDLPWNPMRMVQRIGRLYRYGQQKRVVVFNLQSLQTFDSAIIDLMYRRLNEVTRDMSTIGNEFQEGLADEILGEIAESIDVQELLQKSAQFNRIQSAEELENAIQKAKKAVNLQRELFASAAGFQRRELEGSFTIDVSHLEAFLAGMATYFAINIEKKTQGGRVWHLSLPNALVDKIPQIRSNSIKITSHRDLAGRFSGIDMFDFSHPLMHYFWEHARSSKFGGYFAFIEIAGSRAVATAMLRWQNEQGQRMREEFVVLRQKSNGKLEHNSKAISDWLLHPAKRLEFQQTKSQSPQNLSALFQEAFDAYHTKHSTDRLHPENCQWITAGWCDKIVSTTS